MNTTLKRNIRKVFELLEPIDYVVVKDIPQVIEYTPFGDIDICIPSYEKGKVNKIIKSCGFRGHWFNRFNNHMTFFWGDNKIFDFHIDYSIPSNRVYRFSEMWLYKKISRNGINHVNKDFELKIIQLGLLRKRKPHKLRLKRMKELKATGVIGK